LRIEHQCLVWMRNPLVNPDTGTTDGPTYKNG